MQYKNFYETVAEATIRLRGTIVLYEGEPFEVICITDHKGDGIFRIYMEPIGGGQKKMKVHMDPDIPTRHYPYDDHAILGKKMDEYLAARPDSPILRKYMTSSGFNKFRPFPLGMTNDDGNCFYLERSPLRSTPQGLTKQMVSGVIVGLSEAFTPYNPALHGPGFRAMVVNDYPSFVECLNRLKEPGISNKAVGFHRKFAVVVGPIGTRFLAYKSDLIGVIVNGDASVLRLAPEFTYTKEVVTDLGIFNQIEA